MKRYYNQPKFYINNKVKHKGLKITGTIVNPAEREKGNKNYTYFIKWDKPIGDRTHSTEEEIDIEMVVYGN